MKIRKFLKLVAASVLLFIIGGLVAVALFAECVNQGGGLSSYWSRCR